MPAHTVVGLAVARQKGYYPTPGGALASVKEGKTFEVLEGFPVDDWADALPSVKEADLEAQALADAPPAPPKKTKGKAAAPPVGDIA